MKLAGLRSPLRHFEPLGPAEKNKIPPLRSALFRQCATVKFGLDFADLNEVVFKVAEKLEQSKDDWIEITPEELDALTIAVRANPAGFMAFYQGQILSMLRKLAEPAPPAGVTTNGKKDGHVPSLPAV